MHKRPGVEIYSFTHGASKQTRQPGVYAPRRSQASLIVSNWFDLLPRFAPSIWQKPRGQPRQGLIEYCRSGQKIFVDDGNGMLGIGHVGDLTGRGKSPGLGIN